MSKITTSKIQHPPIKIVKIKGHPTVITDGTYICTAPYSLHPELLTCQKRFATFNFNSNIGRFEYAEGLEYQ